jgi:hypothetical protein
MPSIGLFQVTGLLCSSKHLLLLLQKLFCVAVVVVGVGVGVVGVGVGIVAGTIRSPYTARLRFNSEKVQFVDDK